MEVALAVLCDESNVEVHAAAGMRMVVLVDESQVKSNTVAAMAVAVSVEEMIFECNTTAVMAAAVSVEYGSVDGPDCIGQEYHIRRKCAGINGNGVPSRSQR